MPTIVPLFRLDLDGSVWIDADAGADGLVRLDEDGALFVREPAFEAVRLDVDGALYLTFDYSAHLYGDPDGEGRVVHRHGAQGLCQHKKGAQQHIDYTLRGEERIVCLLCDETYVEQTLGAEERMLHSTGVDSEVELEPFLTDD